MVYKILAVDDKPENLFALDQLLHAHSSQVQVLTATTGSQALALTLEHDFCLAIVDVQMPEMDGYELVELLRGNYLTAQLPVIFVSAIFSDEYHHRKGYDVGAVDFMTKPFIPEILVSKVRVFMRLYEQRTQLAEWNCSLERLVEQRTAELAHAYDTTLEGWAKALELRERETAGHSRRVLAMTMRMVQEVHIPVEEQVHIYRGALLHDIGKMGLPDSILLKNGPLSDEEWLIMRRHPVYAYELLKPITYLRPALEIPYCHHERWDGNGYPRGLSGTQIPLSARIFTIVDVWDALLYDRPYRPAMTPQTVYAYLEAEAGKHFDPDLVRLFLQVVTSDSSQS